jgi:hypothetical protein
VEKLGSLFGKGVEMKVVSIAASLAQRGIYPVDKYLFNRLLSLLYQIT